MLDVVVKFPLAVKFGAYLLKMRMRMKLSMKIKFRFRMIWRKFTSKERTNIEKTSNKQSKKINKNNSINRTNN